jgi:DNA replication protein DnaC
MHWEMYREPSWDDMMKFTHGKWETMPGEMRFEAEQKYKLQLHETARRQAWGRLCPPEYQNTNSDRLPKLEQFKQVQNWQYGPRGLLLFGPPRCGKTRSAWSLFQRLHFDERRQIVAFNPMDLKIEVANAWRDREEARHWINRLRSADVLFFDDLDTIKFTEAVEETIYDAFEYRPTHGKPVIVTVNRNGRALAARMNANDRGAKIVERMREYCEVINFI